MAHDHGHHHGDMSGRRLFWAILINVALTVAQVIGGLLSGSLSLLADALHNLSDAGALAIAYVAKRISGLPGDSVMTYGYGRAEILGALINSVTLVLVGGYLFYESIDRFLNPSPVEGWTVIAVAGVALLIDLVTAFLMRSGAKDSINMRAAFIHNLSDAMASVVVIISGALIILYETYWVDLIATVIISGYVIWQAWHLIKSCVRTLMQGIPEGVDREAIVNGLRSIEDVIDVHHVHIWQLHENFRSLEAHVVVRAQNLSRLEGVKSRIKETLLRDFSIQHSTLEFELDGESKCN